MASKIEASTPTAWRRIQLRAIWAKTAIRTIPRINAWRSWLRSTASPRRMPRLPRIASERNPVLTSSVAASATSGDHHGRPSGPTSVTEASAPSVASIAMIGSSAPSSGATRGLSAGADRRSAAMRAATPSWAFTRLPTKPMLDARYRRRRSAVPPAAVTQMCHASVRARSATTWSAVAASRTPSGADLRAAANSSPLPASATARPSVAAMAATTVSARRWRR